jgi:MYXO-CTERM domain-containing protein
VVLLAIGLTVSLPGQRFLEIAWPVLLIGFGLYLLIRRRRPGSVVPTGSAEVRPPSPAAPEGQGKVEE